MLEINSINAGYDGHQVLKDLTLKIEPRTVMALIGPNGSGKTTLIRAVSGVIPVLSGSIRIMGKELTEMTARERALSIAVVPQARTLPAAFSGYEVVALGRTPHLNWLGNMSDFDRIVVDRALRQMDLLDLAGRDVAALSGGEQQRLYLARALAQETPLVLMDEPTTHLDMQFQVNLMQRIYSLAHPSQEEAENGEPDKTVIVSIHDLNLISKYADMVGLLVNGKLEVCAPPGDVLRSEILSEAYQLPIKVLHDRASGHAVIFPDN